MDCVNLKREFGREFRVQYEESYYAEYGTDARVEAPVNAGLKTQLASGRRRRSESAVLITLAR